MITKRTKSLGLISLVYCATAAGVFGYSQAELAKRGAVLEENVTLVANNNALEETFFTTRQLLQRTEGDRAALESFILSEDETIGFLAEVEQVAAEQGVSLTTKSLDLTPSSELVDELTAVFAFSGPPAATRRLLETLETLPYESSLTGLELSFGEGQAQGQVTLVMSIVSYD